MATVVITFFLLTRFYVYKMDAELLLRPRSGELSRREKRWSMNSQRLEEIVAELMRPISDVRRSFDTDLSSLLEEYLTEAGLHALEASEAGSPPPDAAPNYAELALLLQHSACVYGRKVDYLYQHVISVSEELQNSTQELTREVEADEEVEARTPGGSRRRRRQSVVNGFSAIDLETSTNTTREPSRARPPPTLPRAYIELEPRALTASDHPLVDYEGEAIGLLADFHVTWRLQGGMLVDELEQCEGGASLRPLPLMELQAALEAAAPPALPPITIAPDPDLEPDRDHSPSPERLLDLPSHPLHTSTPLPLPAPRRERKRKSDTRIDDLVGGSFKIVINKELARRLARQQEFSACAPFTARIVAMRSAHILRCRKRLKAQARKLGKEFRGFESSELDTGGFAGWSCTEVEAARATAATALAAADAESDDDGFFEQSSLGDSDGSRAGDPTPPTPAGASTADHTNPWCSWQASVVSRAAEREARAPDVRELAGRLLSNLPRADDCATAPPMPCDQLFSAAGDRTDLPALFLASLFLANAGNVEILQGEPLTVNTFSVRFLSDDARKYCAAADAEFIR